MKTTKTLILLFLMSLASSCVIGCSATQKRVKRIQDAGSTHVAVLSVARWEKYRDALQPQFKLAPEDAVSQSIPNTAAFEERILDAFGLRAKVGLPSTSTTASTTTHNETGQPTHTASDVTSSSAPGDASSITFEPSPAAGSTAASLPGTNVTSGAIGTDPLLKYWTALALWQEVQLINRYVKDAAIDERFAPYLVRLQVSILPRYRNEPYDAYTTISFFVGDFPDHDVFPDSATALEPKPEDSDDVLRGRNRKHLVVHADQTTPLDIPTSESEAQIIPLLVTDDLEAAMQSRSVDQVRQFALGLSALVHGVGLGADLQKVQDTLRSGLSRDFNATFTVARVSHDTLRVRMGALQHVGAGAAAEYSMIPQTHNVTLVLLVPKALACKPHAADRLVRVVSKTTMADAVTGDYLDNARACAIRQAYQQAFRDHGSPVPAAEQIAQIVRCVASNDRQRFGTYIHDLGLRIHFLDSLWVDLVSLRDTTQYETASVVIPPTRSPRVLDESQSPLLMDDGKNAMTAYVTGAIDMDPTELVGTLTTNVVPLKGEPQKPEAITLSATSIGISDSGNQLQLTFPSLGAFNRKPQGDVSLRIRATNRPLALPNKALVSIRGCNELKCAYVLKEPDKPGFGMAVRARVIDSSSKGEGTIDLVFEDVPATASIVVSLVGGDIAGVSADPQDMQTTDPKKGRRVVKNGVLRFQLANLHPISSVVITAKDEKGNSKEATVVVPVVQLPSDPQKSK